VLNRRAPVALALALTMQPLAAEASGWQPPLAWAAYIVANPTTTPKDVERVRQAIRELPRGRAQYPVRMSDTLGVEGAVTAHLNMLLGPPEVWLSRQGTNYRSGRAVRLAGTIVHESAHLEGASELEARARQLEFLRRVAAAGRGTGVRGHIRLLERDLAQKERLSRELPSLAYLGQPMIRR
jgi:hypothetical protein